MNNKKIINYVRKKEVLFSFLTLVNISLLLVVIGGSVNNLAINYNDGKMPVYTDCLNSNEHFSFTDKSSVKLFYLTDIFKSKIKEYGTYYSMGDAVMSVGLIFTFITSTIIIIYLFKLKNLERDLRKLPPNKLGGFHQS